MFKQTIPNTLRNIILIANHESYQTPTGTKKNDVLNFKCPKPAQGQKKTKLLNFKVRKTCTGTENKNFSGIAAPSQVDCTHFIFLVFVCPCVGLGHFESSFFVPVQV